MEGRRDLDTREARERLGVSNTNSPAATSSGSGLLEHWEGLETPRPLSPCGRQQTVDGGRQSSNFIIE